RKRQTGMSAPPERGRQECLPHQKEADRNVCPTRKRQTGMSAPPERGRQECLPHQREADRNVCPTHSTPGCTMEAAFPPASEGPGALNRWRSCDKVGGLPRGRSSVVERHVANVNVEGSTPFARLT